MEQHPVPQNVTTFQFRLIGDMTLKQFGYLCAGAILAFVAYKLPLPFIITWPLTFAFAFLGVGFAFIPVEERPMDVWVFSFFKSIYNPTQYVWIKEAPKPEPTAQAAKRVVPAHEAAASVTPASPPQTQKSKSMLSSLFQSSPSAMGPGSNLKSNEHATTVVTTHPAPSMFSWLSDLWTPKQHPSNHEAPNAPVSPLQFVPRPVTGHKPQVTPQSVNTTPKTQTESVAVQQKMRELEASLKELQSQLATKNMASDRVLELQSQLTDVLKQRSTMEDELVSLKRQLTSRGPSVAAEPDTQPQSATHETPKTTTRSTVTVINTQDDAVKVGLPRLTTVANVITGLVQDDEGNMLPGILVTVTNKEGIPVRALKTNKLGQFAASTPLGSGVYFVEVEDPRARFSFSRVQITLNGTVVPALGIVAKSEKQRTREKLAQEIFGGQNM